MRSTHLNAMYSYPLPDDYKKYNKILKKKDCFKHQIENGLKSKVRSLIIKANSYLFYNYLVR